MMHAYWIAMALRSDISRNRKEKDSARLVRAITLGAVESEISQQGDSNDLFMHDRTDLWT